MRVSSVFTLTALLCLAGSAEAQCNSEKLKSQCVPQLTTGFNYIRSYAIDGIGGTKAKIEYSYVFCKGTQYLIDICSPEKSVNGIIVNLYDSKRNKVATSKIDNTCVPRLAYQCSSSGIYYMQYTFDGNAPYCGGSALAFKRN